MRRFLLLAALVACVASLAACSRAAPKLYDLRRAVDAGWGHCVYVEVSQLKIDSYDEKTVRYSFVLRVRVPGDYPGKVECPDDRRKLLEAVANKDIADLKYGELFPVTEETTY